MIRVPGKRFLFLVIYLAAVFLVFEAASRITLAMLDATWEPVVPPELGRFDPELGWALKPDKCASSKRTGQRIEYCSNSQGFRDDEIPFEKPPKWRRIVLLGDSRSYGFGVTEEQRFSNVIEGYFKRVDVINMGVDGYGVDQELLLLRKHGFQYDPDLVMAYVAHYKNKRHMKDQLWGVGKPRFTLENGELVLHNSPVSNTPTWYRTLRALDSSLGGWCKLYQILRDSVVALVEKRNAAAKQERREAAKAKQRQKSPEQIEREELEYLKKEYEVNELAEAIVFEMHRECQARGVKFLLLTGIERLYNECLERGIMALNVTRPLGNSTFALPGKLRHFNEAGSGALGMYIAEYLMKTGLITPANIPGRWPFSNSSILPDNAPNALSLHPLNLKSSLAPAPASGNPGE